VSALLTGANVIVAPTGNGALNLQLSSGIKYTNLNITANPGVALAVIANSGIFSFLFSIFLFFKF
jgi:hypothetical protein